MILFEYSLNQSFTLFQHFNHYPILSLWVSVNHFSRRTFLFVVQNETSAVFIMRIISGVCCSGK